MKVPTIRLIAADMDGTLLNSQSRVSQGNLRAIRAAEAAGIIFCICTGRFFENASIFAKDAGMTGPLITLNGGKIADAPYGRTLAEHKMDNQTARACLRILDELDASYFVFADKFVGIRKHGMLHHSQIDYGTRMETETGTRYAFGREGCQRALDKGIYKYYVNAGSDSPGMQRMLDALAEVPNLTLTHSSATNIEIMPPHVDKEHGVKELAERFGISMENVMAVGDHSNDLRMIVSAGFGVAMANATNEVRAVAKAVTLSNDEDGVARAIWDYALSPSSGQA